MFAINVQANLKPLMKGLDDLAKKQIPFATARALTAVAKKVQKAETDAISDIFDRPTLFTQRSVGVKAAKKADLTATVFVKDIAAKYLEPFEIGGKHFLPPSKRGGTLLNPKAIPLNQYGNLPKGKLRRLMGKPDVFVGAVAFKSGQTSAASAAPAAGLPAGGPEGRLSAGVRDQGQDRQDGRREDRTEAAGPVRRRAARAAALGLPGEGEGRGAGHPAHRVREGHG